MNKVLSLLACLLLVSAANSQIIQFFDQTTLEPIQGVELSAVDSETIFATSNEKGEIAIKPSFANKVVWIYHPSYELKKYNLEEVAGLGANETRRIPLVIMDNSLEEIVVSGSKFEEKKKDLVQKVQVISTRELENMNQSSTADVIANTGNVMVQKSQLGGGSPIIRGFETNKVLIVVDGIRMNNAIYRGGHLQNIVTLDNAIMERAEVVYGPGSVVYGSDAIGGVMSFRTKNPLLSSGDNLLVKGSGYARYHSAANGMTGHAHVSVGKKRFGSLTSVTYSQFGDLRQGATRNPSYPSFGARNWSVERINGMDSMIVNKDTNLQVGSGYTQYDFLQKFLFAPTKNATHLLNLQYSTSSDVPRYDRLTQTSSNGLPKYAEWYYGPQNRLLAAYTFEHARKTKLYDDLVFTLAYQNIEESRIDRRFQKNMRNHRIEQLNIGTMNLDLAKRINRHEIRYGAELLYNDVNSTAFVEDIVADTTGALDTRYPDGGSQMYSGAIYGTHKMEINEKWVLNDGLRFTHVGLQSKFVDQTFFPFPFSSLSQSNNAVNGNLGMVFMPTNRWRIVGGVSSGFRAPNVDDVTKVFDSQPGTVVVPNPDLKAEYSYNAELGVSRDLMDGLTISTTGYYTELVNALTVQNATFNGADSIMYSGQLSQVRTTVNAGSAYVYGFEGGLSGRLNEFVKVFATVNYTYGRIRTDSTDYPLDHIPPVFGKVNFNVHLKKFSGDFFVNYAGWKRLEDYNLVGEDNYAFATPEGMPSWFTLNARLNYAISRNLRVQLACENILDQNYRVFASNISAPGRNFIITLRGSF